MRYNKPFLSFEQQADLLIARGLVADRSHLICCLKDVNYYRLSAYLCPYRQPNNNYQTATTFEIVWRHYTFDRQLRLVVMDAIERFEVSIKTQIIYAFASLTGHFGYSLASNFSQEFESQHERLIKTIQEEVDRSRETFVSHFQKKYIDNYEYLPLCMVGEIMSFGCALTFYRGLPDKIKQEISRHYGIPHVVLTSWLQTIHVIRNICAHHSRLWNKNLGVKPYIPRKKKYPDWHYPVPIIQNKVFGILTILNYLLRISAPHSNWKARLSRLLDEYPEISREMMGFPEHWQELPLWKDLTK